MSEERIIGAVQKSDNDQVRVTIKEWDQRPYVHIRLWHRGDGEDEYRFTAKGVALKLPEARELCSVFKQLEAELDKMN
jgi:hypothetical protein